jgi:glycosyltransferase involved in cell wall biosynthesis
MDIFVLPSYREGMSNALLEAQATGIPCITTDVVGCVDAVRPGVSALVVPPRSPADLARAIDALAVDEDRRRSMARAGQAWVRENFDQKAQWRRYLDLYGTPRSINDAD